MNNKLNEQILVMQTLAYTNRQVTSKLKQYNDEIKNKLNKHEYYLDEINTLLKQVLVKNKNSLTDKMDPPKAQDTTTVVTANKKDQPLKGGNSRNIGGMWNLKYDIISPKLNELLIKIELKGETALYLKNFYNHIKMCLDGVARLQEKLLSAYQYIKRHSEFEE